MTSLPCTLWYVPVTGSLLGFEQCRVSHRFLFCILGRMAAEECFDLDVNFVPGSMATEDSLQGTLDFLSALKAGSVPISGALVWTEETGGDFSHLH